MEKPLATLHQRISRHPEPLAIGAAGQHLHKLTERPRQEGVQRRTEAVAEEGREEEDGGADQRTVDGGAETMREPHTRQHEDGREEADGCRGVRQRQPLGQVNGRSIPRHQPCASPHEAEGDVATSELRWGRPARPYVFDKCQDRAGWRLAVQQAGLAGQLAQRSLTEPVHHRLTQGDHPVLREPPGELPQYLKTHLLVRDDERSLEVPLGWDGRAAARIDGDQRPPGCGGPGGKPTEHASRPCEVAKHAGDLQQRLVTTHLIGAKQALAQEFGSSVNRPHRIQELILERTLE